MALPPAFPTHDTTQVDFRISDGLEEPDRRLREAGLWANCERKSDRTACFAAVTQIVDIALGGTDPTTGDWRIDVVPITTQSGSAAADGMGPAFITINVAAQTLANVVLALIDQSNDAANLLTLADADAWKRFRSYVRLSVSPTGATVLRASAIQSDQTFSITVTPSGGSTVTPTTIAEPDATTLKVGLYAGIDRTKGANGYNGTGQPFVKVIETSTPVADYLGPIRFGSNTEPVDAGYALREYGQGSNVPYPAYGDVYTYGEAAIDSLGEPVYVRHTAAGDFLTGMVTNAAGAAAGATANLWTGTPTVVNDIWYSQTITIGDVIETISFLSDGTATDVEINDGLRASLATKTSLTGLVTGSGTTTLILTGPADGRAFTPVDVGPGVMTLVETTPAVSTHNLFARDKFGPKSKRIGSVPVVVPHSNA